jgi:hypothetical protein
VGPVVPSDVTNGDKDEGCLFNQTVAKKVGSEVRISEGKDFKNYEFFNASTPAYPLEVSPPMPRYFHTIRDARTSIF